MDSEQIDMLPSDPGKLFTFSTITETTGESEHERLEEIEVIFGSYERIGRDALRKCWNLRNLTLINCGLKELSNLEPVGDSLVHLCLSNQSITQMCGLSALPQLRRLYLQQNRIAQIEGLESCRKLQTLWLYDNRLTEVENLGYCTDLRELWLQNNAIRSLKATGGGVSELVNLKTLNLANNRIRDVEELEHLRKLIALRQLTFRDEHFGSNPIADHPDYRSFAVTTLKQLRQLDGNPIRSEERTTAEDQFFAQSMDFNDHVAELTLAYQQELRSIATRKERGSSNAQMLQQELIEALNEVETCVTAGQTQIREEKQRQLQLREQNSQLLRESLAKLQQDFRVAIDEQYEREERALLAEERKYEQMELEALAEQNQALTIAALQNAFPTKIAFQQLLEHTPDYRHIAATFQTQQQGDAGNQDGREVHILQIYRCFHEDLTAAFEAHTKEMESSDGLSSTEGSELYLYLVADDDQVISLLQNGLVSATSSVDSIDSIASWVFLFSNPVVALQFYKGTIGELEVLEERETEADSHEKRSVSGTSSGLEGGQASLVPEQSLPAVETFNLLLCQVRLQHTIELFRPETVRLDSLESLHSIARPRGAVLQPPPSSFLQLEVGGRDSWSASPSGGHVYMARRASVQAQVVPQFVLLCSKRDGSTGDPGSGGSSRICSNSGNNVDDELGALTSDALLSRFQQQLRSEVDAYHSRLYREVDPATVRVRAQFLQEQEQLHSRLQDTEGQIGQEKREQECILRALRGGNGGRVSGVERGVAKRG